MGKRQKCMSQITIGLQDYVYIWSARITKFLYTSGMMKVATLGVKITYLTCKYASAWTNNEENCK